MVPSVPVQSWHRQTVADVEMRMNCVDNLITHERVCKDTSLAVRHDIAILEFDPRSLCCCDDPCTESRCI